MSVVRLIDGLSVRDDGPAFVTAEGDYLAVSLVQGTVDGACGPYCLLMGLALAGAESIEDIKGLHEQHGNSALGRFRRAIADETFIRGTRLPDLARVLRASHKKRLSLSTHRGRDADVLPFVLGHLALDRAVIVGLRGDVEHWVLVVGSWTPSQRGGHPLLLALDPGFRGSRAAPWNSSIALDWNPGEDHPHLYGDDAEVSIEHALAFWLPA